MGRGVEPARNCFQSSWSEDGYEIAALVPLDLAKLRSGVRRFLFEAQFTVVRPGGTGFEKSGIWCGTPWSGNSTWAILDTGCGGRH